MPVETGRPNAIQTVIDNLPEDLPRFIVDGLPRLRIWAGPKLADKLYQKSPEERTWTDGVMAGALGVTDKLDGIGAGIIGPTEYGRELDREGDRSFVMPQQRALSHNGEIPAAHYGLKVARERAMQGLRWWGARNGKDLKSLQVNRAKTVAEMTHLTMAHSPLSQNEELMRWGASVGTALSLTGLAETVFQYMQKDEDEEVTTARNSTARQMSAGPLERLATLVDEKAPGITPDHITTAGKLGVELSALLAVINPDHPVLPTTFYTIWNLFDAFDGSLARKKGRDGMEGMIKDVRADLEQQIVTMGALSVIAMRRGNRVAASNYALASMLTPLSALTRAQAESQGLIVAEGGMGTRVGRGILGGVGMGLNRHRDASDIVSAMLAASTANTVLERRDVVKNGTDSRYDVGVNTDPQFMEEAVVRQKAILPYARLGLAVGSVLLAANASPVARGRAVEAAKVAALPEAAETLEA
jgi:phosphatidylglycerophosphate synthase